MQMRLNMVKWTNDKTTLNATERYRAYAHGHRKNINKINEFKLGLGYKNEWRGTLWNIRWNASVETNSMDAQIPCLHSDIACLLIFLLNYILVILWSYHLMAANFVFSYLNSFMSHIWNNKKAQWRQELYICWLCMQLRW